MEPILHFLVPVLILLALYPDLDKRLILKLSPLTLIPELDYFIGHRAIFHNVFFVGIVLIGIYFFSNRNKSHFIVASFFLVSHLLLDLPGLGVALFYPFYDSLLGFNFVLYTSPARFGLFYTGGTFTQALEEATKDQFSPIVTAFGVIFLALVLGASMAKKNSRFDEMKRALVTGGLGFIGHNTIMALLEKGCKVTSLDNCYTNVVDSIPGRMYKRRCEERRRQLTSRGFQRIFSEMLKSHKKLGNHKKW